MNKNTIFKIEKSIPIPPHKSTNAKFPILDMKVGDSFEVHSLREATSVRTCFNNRGFKCTIRVQVDGTYRCWRIA